MKFSLVGVSKLKSPVVVVGRVYVLRHRPLTSETVASFTSPKGAKIDLTFAAYPDGSWIWPSVDGVLIKHPTDYAFGNTSDLPAALRPLIEQAIVDLEFEERRLDPTKRHVQAKSAAEARKAEADRVAKALKRL